MKKKIKGIMVLILPVLLAFSQSVYSQDNSRRLEGSMSFNVGYLNLDNAEFQTFLNPQFDDLGSHYGLIGGSGYLMLGDFLLGASGQAIFGPEVTNRNQKVELSGGMGFLHFGYAFINQKRIKVFPLIGIGGGAMELSNLNKGDIRMDEVQDNARGEMKIGVINPMLDFSLGLDFSPYFKNMASPKSGGGLNLGIRAGYIYGIENNNWFYRGGDVIGGPDFGMRSFYVKMLVGVSGFLMVD